MKWFNFIYVFVCLFVCLLAALGLCGCAWATLCYGAQASHCGGFSCCRAQALGTRASVVWLMGSRAQSQ